MENSPTSTSTSTTKTSWQRGLLKGLVVIVCLGYLILWVMMPTNTYQTRWFPFIKSNLSSTYFGTQGPVLLLFTFPVIFVAVVGCIYLHLGKQVPNMSLHRSEEKRKKNEGGLARWRRPLLVRGSLGIVTWVELGFLLMFIALLVWFFATSLRFGFSQISPEMVMWKAKLKDAGLRIGLLGNFCLCFLFFPVTRGSSVLPIFGLSSEMSIKYHIWLGHIVMTLFTAHGLCFIVLWAASGKISNMLHWNKTGISVLAGEIALLSGLVLWSMTFPRIRRKTFEAFFYTHHLYIAFVFFFFLHIKISGVTYMLPGLYLFMIDRYLRFLQSRQRVRLLSSRVLSSEAFELNFSKSPRLKYSPTSIMFINVPSISRLQWHPFTVTSSSGLETDNLSVVIKVEGSWTRMLYQMLASSTSRRMEVAIEGPYGPSKTDFLRHDMLVMVSGGSGITPFFSIIRELVHVGTMLNSKIPKLHLICVFRNSSDLGLLDLLLPMGGTRFELSSIELKIEAYVTREKRPEGLADAQRRPQTFWFEPNAKDVAISPILGENGRIWLALIISSSFVGFLVLLGLLNRCYIYPIDHNTDKIFPTSAGAILNILIMCVSIASTASVAVLWNRKRNAMEARSLVDMTPGSQFLNAERELESLPHQSLVEPAKVHYGERPDFKRLLSNCKGSSTGVLVSGPKRMRQEVAATCKSGVADNLHFESISFSW